jgi:hypothetical protein
MVVMDSWPSQSGMTAMSTPACSRQQAAGLGGVYSGTGMLRCGWIWGLLGLVDVAQGGVDAQSEHVADTSDISAARECFVEDAVLAQLLGAVPEGGVDPLVVDLFHACSCPDVDEQVRVRRVRPPLCPVVEVGGDAVGGGRRKGDDQAAEVQTAVSDVG